MQVWKEPKISRRERKEREALMRAAVVVAYGKGMWSVDPFQPPVSFSFSLEHGCCHLRLVCRLLWSSTYDRWPPLIIGCH